MEEEVYGINHALVGQLALQQWGLPRLIVDKSLMGQLREAEAITGDYA
jgi:hypothetical protein